MRVWVFSRPFGRWQTVPGRSRAPDGRAPFSPRRLRRWSARNAECFWYSLLRPPSQLRPAPALSADSCSFLCWFRPGGRSGSTTSRRRTSGTRPSASTPHSGGRGSLPRVLTPPRSGRPREYRLLIAPPCPHDGEPLPKICFSVCSQFNLSWRKGQFALDGKGVNTRGR